MTLLRYDFDHLMSEADLLQFQLLTPFDVQRQVAARLRSLRLAAGLTQSTLAVRAGVSVVSLRRFEQRSTISLKHLLRLCSALGRLEEFDTLLRPAAATTMAELEVRASVRQRKRGST